MRLMTNESVQFSASALEVRHSGPATQRIRVWEWQGGEGHGSHSWTAVLRMVGPFFRGGDGS